MNDKWTQKAEACFDNPRPDESIMQSVACAIENAARAAREEERERCAKIAEEESFPFDIDVWLGSTKKEMTAHVARAIAAAIRKGTNDG